MPNQQQVLEGQKKVQALKDTVINLLDRVIAPLREQDRNDSLSEKEMDEKPLNEIKVLEDIKKAVGKVEDSALLEQLMPQAVGLLNAVEEIKNTKKELEKSEEDIIIGPGGYKATQETESLRRVLGGFERGRAQGIENLRKFLGVQSAKQIREQQSAQLFQEEMGLSLAEWAQRQGVEIISIEKVKIEGQDRFMIQASGKDGEKLFYRSKQSNGNPLSRKINEKEYLENLAQPRSRQTLEQASIPPLPPRNQQEGNISASGDKRNISQKMEDPLQYTQLDWNHHKPSNIIHGKRPESTHATILSTPKAQEKHYPGPINGDLYTIVNKDSKPLTSQASAPQLISKKQGSSEQKDFKEKRKVNPRRPP